MKKTIASLYAKFFLYARRGTKVYLSAQKL